MRIRKQVDLARKRLKQGINSVFSEYNMAIWQRKLRGRFLMGKSTNGVVIVAAEDILTLGHL